MSWKLRFHSDLVLSLKFLYKTTRLTEYSFYHQIIVIFSPKQTKSKKTRFHMKKKKKKWLTIQNVFCIK